MKPFIPLIRIISVEHDKTLQAQQHVCRALQAKGITYPVREVYCHLEASRCGVQAGMVGVEVEGRFAFVGAEVTEEVAATFAEKLPLFVEHMKREYGLS
ncbi:hypothetical protein [Desulfovibrio cuneatus]|uniref:hypothetical protein n=1 Tax=Desulfovibrio cuneatus TaxID=159728 RepID=UPI00040D7DA5|nr:hypothetical protein [Desulfovibrio cuneatus]